MRDGWQINTKFLTFLDDIMILLGHNSNLKSTCTLYSIPT